MLLISKLYVCIHTGMDWKSQFICMLQCCHMDYFKLFDFISTKKSFTSENRQEQLSDLFAFLGSESFQAMPIRTL